MGFRNQTYCWGRLVASQVMLHHIPKEFCSGWLGLMITTESLPTFFNMRVNNRQWILIGQLSIILKHALEVVPNNVVISFLAVRWGGMVRTRSDSSWKASDLGCDWCRSRSLRLPPWSTPLWQSPLSQCLSPECLPSRSEGIVQSLLSNCQCRQDSF